MKKSREKTLKLEPKIVRLQQYIFSTLCLHIITFLYLSVLLYITHKLFKLTLFSQEVIEKQEQQINLHREQSNLFISNQQISQQQHNQFLDYPLDQQYFQSLNGHHGWQSSQFYPSYMMYQQPTQSRTLYPQVHQQCLPDRWAQIYQNFSHIEDQQSTILGIKDPSLPNTKLQRQLYLKEVASQTEDNQQNPKNFSSNRCDFQRKNSQSITSQNNNLLKVRKLQSNGDLKLMVFNQINFLIENLKQKKKPDLEVLNHRKMTKEWEYHTKLKELYETLYSYYLQSSKTKEEMIKFIIRRCFKEKRAIKHEQEKINLERQLDLYCPPSQINELNRLLNDDMKKMSSSFINKLFASQQFKIDYNNFFIRYDELADKVNKKKINNLVEDVLDCLLNDQPIQNILIQTRRYPWLRVWLDASKLLAEELPYQDKLKQQNKESTRSQRNKNKSSSLISLNKRVKEN